MGRQSRPLTGWVSPQGRPTVAAFRGCEFRRSASLFIGSAKGSNDNLARQPAGMRRAATLPHGSAHAWRIMMPKLQNEISVAAREARLLRFARNDGGHVVVKRQMPSLRGARSATKQSLPPGRSLM